MAMRAISECKMAFMMVTAILGCYSLQRDGDGLPKTKQKQQHKLKTSLVVLVTSDIHNLAIRVTTSFAPHRTNTNG